MKAEDQPYALTSAPERQRRAAMQSQPHMEPLLKCLAAIRAEHPEKKMPNFDPCDGGVLARVLFLLEAPGAKAVGSSFISRNNPDPTARNMCGLLQEAGIARGDTLLWNIVPWYVGDGNRIRAVNRADIEQALPHLKQLLGLLPALEAIVLVGKKAQSAQGRIRQFTSLPFIETHHPSGRVFNVWPHKRDEMKMQLLQVAESLRRDG